MTKVDALQIVHCQSEQHLCGHQYSVKSFASPEGGAVWKTTTSKSHKHANGLLGLGLVGRGAQVGSGRAALGEEAGEDWLDEGAADDLSAAG